MEKQKGTDAVTLLSSISKAQERYFAVNEVYAKDFSSLDTELVDAVSQTPAKGDTYYNKYFKFQLVGEEDGTSKVKATRLGNESYVVEQNYTTSDVCCTNDNTADGDICNILNIPNDTCSGQAEGETGGTGGGGGTTPTCTGTAPDSSQACSSGCGTQTRSVTCSGTTWTTGSWDTSSCASPTQTQATSQSCGTGGTQTRTCTASCTGGSCGAWSTCVVTTCDSSTKPAESQTCSTGCGTQTRTVTCSSGTWTTTAWTGTCTSPTQTQATSQTCASGCGTQTRTCTPSCNGGTCGEWTGTCTKECTDTKPDTTQACGNCGGQTRTVSCDTSTGNWVEGAWSACSGEGVCKPGDTNLVHCGRYTGYGVSGTEAFIYKNVTCTEGCTYPTVGNCDECKESPNCNKRFANGQIGACYCIKALEPSCPNTEDASLCTACGGAWNASTCTCNCGTGYGVACTFNSTYGCLCGQKYRNCI